MTVLENQEGREPEPEKMALEGRNPNGTFRPGFVANPNGRPKFSIVSILREKLAEVPEGEKRSRAQILVDEIMAKAIIEKDVAMMKDILDRIDGKPKQAIVGGEDDDEAVKMTVTINRL